MNFNNCEQIEARLSDYMEGALPPEEASAFMSHTASCATCRELVASVRGLVGEMHALEPVAAPMNLVSAILDNTLGPRTAPGNWKAWFGWTRTVFQPRFAYGALTILITLGVLSQAFGIQWETPTVADLNPVTLYRAADRQAHIVYARGSKFVGDLRVVYEIRSRLQPGLDEDSSPQKSPATQPGAPGRSEAPSGSPKNLNRARFTGAPIARLACGLWLTPIRSKP
jgi:anti-sigma factor RsiW